MKTFFSLLLTFAMATPALAQGKIRLVNDSLHLVYWARTGQPYLIGGSGITLAIELWAGTSSVALSLVAATDFAGQGAPGVWPGMNVTLPSPNFPAGATFFTIEIYDAAAGSYANALGRYVTGTTGIFSANSSSTIAYNSLVQHIFPAFSTWADGAYNMDFLSPGFRGAIAVDVWPEPSVMALGGLALAMLLVHRRAETRKIKK